MNDITKKTGNTTPEENNAATAVHPPKRKISVYQSGGKKIGEYENVPQATATKMLGRNLSDILEDRKNKGKTAAHAFNDELKGRISYGAIINDVSSSLQSGEISLEGPKFKEEFRLKLYQLSSSEQKPSALYTFLKLEYEKVLETSADKTSQEKEDIVTAHMRLVMTTFWVEVLNLFYTNRNEAQEKNPKDPNVFNKAIKEIANDSQLCWMLAVYASRVTKEQLKNLSEKKHTYTLRNPSDGIIEVFNRLSKKQNSFFYKYISSIQLRCASLEGSLLQNIFNNPKIFYNKQQAQEDTGSMFFYSLDPLVIPDVNQKPTFYDIENQPNLLKFYPYTSLDKIVQELKQDNSAAFLLLVAELQLKKLSVPHFCIMLKRIFVECANDPNFQTISSTVLKTIGDKLINDDRVMKLLSKTPQFFSILSKYIENLPPLPQGESFKDTYPIVHHFRHHTDFNLNLFRARKEAERNTNQATNNASVVNHIFEHHLKKSCLSMSWWLGNKPTGARYQQVYEHVSTVVDTYSDEKTITVEKIIKDLTQEIKDLSKGLVFLVSSNRRTALGSLKTRIMEIFTEEHRNKTFSELENINDLQKCIEDWKLETVLGSTKPNEELFRGNGWKPTKVQMLLNSIESAIDKTLLAKKSSTGVNIQSSP